MFPLLFCRSSRLDSGGRLELADESGHVGGTAADQRSGAQVSDERQGAVPDEPGHVSGASATRRQNAVPRLSRAVGTSNESVK